MKLAHRSRISFGKRAEFKVIARLLENNFDVYLPLVDDHGVDAIVKTEKGEYREIQIKARSKEVKLGNSAIFAALDYCVRENYYFIFYSEILDTFWLFESAKLFSLTSINKSGKNSGKHTIKLNGKKSNVDYPLTKYKEFETVNFEKLG
jgi:hypothetical protein